MSIERPMKDSGLGWAGKIPAHWDTAKVCLVARLESGHTPSRQKPEYWIPEECTIPWISLTDIWQLRDGVQKYIRETAEKISPIGVQNSAARVLPAGTVILSRTASVGFSGIMPMPMATTQDFANWICGPRILSEFLLYAFRGMKEEFSRAMMGSTHQTIYMPDIRKLSIPIPSKDEQRKIVDLLDKKLPRIDNLIRKKEELVASLHDKRQATIAQAVTKGLNRFAPMKDSHAEWIGMVPAHWRVARVKHVARLESGHTPSRSVAEHWLENNNIPWVSLNDTKLLAENDYISETVYYINELGLRNSSARLLPAKSVVFTRDATIGKAAITTKSMAVSQHIIAWICSSQIVPEFLLRVFYAMEEYLEYFTFGATIKTIGMDDVGALVTPVPPIGEQLEIVDFIVKRVSSLEQTIAKIEQQIERLREYRQSMITAAVTGQIDPSKMEAA